MTRRFKPVFPGRGGVRYRKDSDHDSDLELVARPSAEEPSLHEFLPLGSHVPVPFEWSQVHSTRYFSQGAPQSENIRLRGKRVQAIYAPGGEVGDAGVHVGCRVTQVNAADDKQDGTVADHHTAMWHNAFNGNSVDAVFTDWVTTDNTETQAYGHRRSSHWHRRPILETCIVPDDVSRPVADQAFVIQSTAWGLVETCAYLAPDPEEARAREVSVTIADRVMREVSEYPVPEPTTRPGTVKE